jgi:hypothetical protein
MDVREDSVAPPAGDGRRDLGYAFVRPSRVHWSARSLAILATAALALLPVAYLFPALLRGDVLTGSTGLFPTDQLQYMALISETSHLHHVLDHFPLFFLSGLLTRAGVDVRVAFLLWVPIGAFVLVAGFDRYVHALITGTRSRAAALVLALFYCSPVAAAIHWIAHPHGDSFAHLVFTTYYLFPAGAVWGYPQIALALGLMPLCFLAVTDQRWSPAAAPLAGALVSFLHPWQGLTVLVVDALVAVSSRAIRTTRMLVAMIGTAAPLGYYWIIERSDARFELTARNTAIDTAPLWVLAAALLPLALAVVGARRISATSLRDRQLIFWPLAALFEYAFVDAAWKPYFLLGATLPLAILAVRGATSLRPSLRPAIATAAVLLLVVPGIVWLGSLLWDRERGEARGAYVLNGGEARALDYVADAPRSGGVLSSGFLAPAAWALTGRDSWAASMLTDPEFAVGGAEAQRLLAGESDARVARRFAARTGAAFVVSGCRPHGPDLRPKLGPLVVETRRFGCAAVYELRPR